MSTFRSEQIQQPVNLTGNFTGDLIGTASYATTASYAIFAENGGGSGTGFPFDGNAVITGSLLVSGSSSGFSGITGSLQGTSSWTTNALTASTADDFTVRGTLVVSGSTTIGDATTDSITLTATTMSIGGGDGILNIDNNTLYVNGSTNTIGVRTSSPNATLDISGSVNVSGSGVQIPFQVLTGSAGSTNPALIVSGSGKVGIGLSNPVTDLDVRGEIRASSAMYAGVGQYNFIRPNGTNLAFCSASSNTAVVATLFTSSGNFVFQSLQGATDLGYRIAINGPSTLGSLYVSGSTILNGNTTITGSFTIATGSTEFQVLDTGTKIGNAITDIHTITGSLNTSGSLDINLGNNKSVRLQSGAGQLSSFLGAPFGNATLSNNVYFNGANWIYEKTGYALLLQLGDSGTGVGAMSISTFPSQTSGSTLPSPNGFIKLTESGLVGIKSSSPSVSSGNAGEVLVSQGGSSPIWSTASFNPGYTQLLQIFSQTGGSAPTVDYEPINTTGDTYTWSYINPGEYRLTSVSLTPFTPGKTSVILSPGFLNGTFASGIEYIFHYEIVNDTKINIFVQKIGSGGRDDVFSQATIDIKIFP